MSTANRTRVKRLVLRVAVISLASMVGLTLLAYAVDYAVFGYRVSTNRQPYGQYTVYPYDAVAQKSGKTQFIFTDPVVETCVHALFPHAGYAPCWYLQRHTEPRTNI